MRKQGVVPARQVSEEESVMPVLTGFMASPIVNHASVIRPDRTAVVDFVIRTAVSVPADMVSEGGSAISVLRVTMVSLIVSGADVIR